MTADEVAQLGAISQALYGSDLACLPYDDTDVVSSIGSLSGWNATQVNFHKLIFLSPLVLWCEKNTGLKSMIIPPTKSMFSGYTRISMSVCPSIPLFI